ncbi:hypothetical protein QJS66_02860 [Kocuria rhizophila]|nr:hypothetical protein QJS66_02860 [Kocuria rhizophila]
MLRRRALYAHHGHDIELVAMTSPPRRPLKHLFEFDSVMGAAGLRGPPGR